MDKRIQAKHVPQAKILEVLQSKRGKWFTHWRPEDLGSAPDASWYLVDAVPELRAFPEKVLMRALGAMARRGEIVGCDCGCRGDWHVP